MSTQNVSTVALHVVSQYNDAGKTLVGAWRAGAHRLLDGATSRYSAFLAQRPLPLLNDDIKARLIVAQEKVNGFLVKRVDIDTGRVAAVMDRVASGATSGIESAAQVAQRAESPLSTSVLNALNALNMPMATVSTQIADRIVAGARKIEARVSGGESTPVVRTAKATTKAKTKLRVKVEAKVEPVARRAVRRTRAAARPARKA